MHMLGEDASCCIAACRSVQSSSQAFGRDRQQSSSLGPSGDKPVSGFRALRRSEGWLQDGRRFREARRTRPKIGSTPRAPFRYHRSLAVRRFATFSGAFGTVTRGQQPGAGAARRRLDCGFASILTGQSLVVQFPAVADRTGEKPVHGVLWPGCTSLPPYTATLSRAATTRTTSARAECQH